MNRLTQMLLLGTLLLPISIDAQTVTASKTRNLRSGPGTENQKNSQVKNKTASLGKTQESRPSTIIVVENAEIQDITSQDFVLKDIQLAGLNYCKSRECKTLADLQASVWSSGCSLIQVFPIAVKATANGLENILWCFIYSDTVTSKILCTVLSPRKIYKVVQQSRQKNDSIFNKHPIVRWIYEPKSYSIYLQAEKSEDSSRIVWLDKKWLNVSGSWTASSSMIDALAGTTIEEELTNKDLMRDIYSWSQQPDRITITNKSSDRYEIQSVLHQALEVSGQLQAVVNYSGCSAYAKSKLTGNVVQGFAIATSEGTEVAIDFLPFGGYMLIVDYMNLVMNGNKNETSNL